MSAPGAAGARLLLSAGAVLAVLAAVRLGEHRAIAPPAGWVDSDPSEKPTLLFIFQPKDCPRYGNLVRRWNSIAREGAVRVVGLGLGFSSSASGHGHVLRTRTAFPVRYDETGEAERLLARIGQPRTPISVLLDGRGRPLVILPPVTDEEVQMDAERLIREFALRIAEPQG